MNNNLFKGLGVAVVTPFKNNNEVDNKVDYDALKKIIQHLINGGVNYLVALGTTAEVPTLSAKEKLKIIECFINEIDKKIPLVIGNGGNNTKALIENIKAYDSFAYDAILSVSPYYNRPSQKAMFHHFEAIANSTDKPIILYNVPARTGGNIEATTTIKLAGKFNNIIGIKEAAGDINQVMEIIARKPADFLVISGDDTLTIPLIAVGGDGLISVIGNAFPQDWAEIVKQSLAHNFETANTLYYKYLKLLAGIYSEGNPTGVKSVMHKLGLCENILRLPLIKASEKLQQKLADELKQFA